MVRVNQRFLNSYARRVDEIAKAAFEAYRSAEKAYLDAEAATKKTPPRNGFVDAQYAARAARVQANYLEAQAAYKEAKREFENTEAKFPAIRRELVAAIDDAYSVDPAQLDTATLELLKAGIMTGSEYNKLLQAAKAANNPTMVRLVGKFAGEAAEARAATHGQNDPEAKTMRLVAYDSRTVTGGDRLEAFDNMVSLFHRCVRNPRMIDSWGEFTAETVQKF